MNHLKQTAIFSLASITMLMVLLVPLTATAAAYYVSTSGLDSNPGTSGSPWRTIQNAANRVSPGDIVYVEDGTYVGFNVTTDGTADSPITFQANGNNVLLNIRNSSTNDIINIEGADYIVIDGFKVEDSPRIGIRAVVARGVVIKNNTVARSGLTGILSGWTPEIQVLNNGAWGSLVEHGIYISNSDVADDDPVIRGNECYGNNKNGIQINGDCWEGGDGVITGAVLEDNFVHDNNWKGMSLISMQNSVIRNNVIYDNGISAGAGGIHLTDQVGPSCGLPSSNNVVVNNTIVEPRIACIRMTDGSTANIVFNNVVIAANTSRLIEDEVGGNYIDSGSNLTTTSSTGHFVNESGHDYHLDPASTAVDRGINSYQGSSAPATDLDGNARPAGSAFDAGAYELQSGPVPDTTPPTASITAPADMATITQPVSVAASASDNVAVVGAQFYVDGTTLGAEVTQAPFSLTMSPSDYSDGTHTIYCTARDAAGNLGTSPSITVIVDNGFSPPDIPATHPRLYNITNRLPALRQRACLDDNGDPIPGCTPGNDYTLWYDANIPTGRGEPWSYALMYMMTGDESYANSAIQMILDEIADGLGQKGFGEREDYFLNGHHYTRNVAVVYDWLNHLISAGDKATMINYMNQLLYEIWNPRTNPCKYSGGWGQGNPRINYYYRHVMAAALVGVATNGENDGMVTFQDCEGEGGTWPLEMPLGDVIYTDPIQFVYANLDELVLPYVLAYEDGGGWHEGTNYGRASKVLMMEIFVILRDAGLLNYFELFDFPRQAILYHLSEMQPRDVNHYTNGDAPRDPLEHPNDSDRHLMLLLVDGLPGTVESQYAQYWINHVVTEMDERKKKAFSFFYYDPTYPERDYRAERPTRYYAPGMNYVNSRSSWADDAVSVNFVSTERFVGHCHKNQNEFAIYKHDWQTVSGNTYTSTGLNQVTRIHNTLTIAGEGQRYGDGTGAIIKYEARPEFTYVVGDASDAYYTDPGAFGHGDQKMIDIFQRELVHVLPDVVVVFDRVTPTANFRQSDVSYHLNSRYQATIQGNLVTCANGAGKVFQRTLLPVAFTAATAVESDGSFQWWRVNITPNTPVPNHQFLHVLYAADASVQSMPATQAVTATSNNMVGVEVTGASENKVIMFSTDPAGKPPVGNIIYEVGMNWDSDHMLMGLVPLLSYDVETVDRGDRRTVVVTEGTGFTASDQGVLTFRLEAAPQVLARDCAILRGN